MPYMPHWGGLGGQCRHIWHTWSVWDIKTFCSIFVASPGPTTFHGCANHRARRQPQIRAEKSRDVVRTNEKSACNGSEDLHKIPWNIGRTCVQPICKLVLVTHPVCSETTYWSPQVKVRAVRETVGSAGSAGSEQRHGRSRDATGGGVGSRVAIVWSILGKPGDSEKKQQGLVDVHLFRKSAKSLLFGVGADHLFFHAQIFGLMCLAHSI